MGNRSGIGYSNLQPGKVHALQLLHKEEYQQGKLLPGETDLAEELSISRNIVRMAIQRLVEDEKLVRRKG